MPNLNRLRYEPYALVAPQVAASILRNATVISLSGGSAAGDTEVRNSWPSPKIPISKTMLLYGTDPITGVSALVGNQVCAYPFVLNQPARIQGITMFASSATAPSMLYFSVFDNTSTVTAPAYPNTKLIEMQKIDCNAIGAGYHSVSTYSLAQLLPVGLYWAVVHNDGNSPTLGIHHPTILKRVLDGLSNATIGLEYACGSSYTVPAVFPVGGPVFASAVDMEVLAFNMLLGA